MACFRQLFQLSGFVGASDQNHSLIVTVTAQLIMTDKPLEHSGRRPATRRLAAFFAQGWQRVSSLSALDVGGIVSLRGIDGAV